MAEYFIVGAIGFFIVLIVAGYNAHVADWNNFFINVIDGWIRIFCRYYHHFIYQPVPVTDTGPSLLACNHLSGLDPFLIVAACRRPIRFMIAREEYERFGLQWLFRAAGCIPVERSGRVEMAFRASLKALHKGEVVALFPEGGINRSHLPLLRLKAGIVKLAKMAKVPITPLRVEDMRAQGHTVLPIFLPSQSRLYVTPNIECNNETDETYLTQLALYLQLKHKTVNQEE